jgi:putative alpha-1,2-mannosidase
MGTDDPRVFWHELAHAAHEATDAEYKSRSSQYKEIVAEFTACVLAALYGFDYSGTSWEYLKMFSPDPLKAIMKAGHHIDQVLNLILTEEEPEEEEFEDSTYTQEFDEFTDADPGL